VIIAGKNGQGKTSLMDAIELALKFKEGVKKSKEPVRHGESQATVQLDLGEYTVTRVIKPDGTSGVTVENARGERQKSPQKLIDGFIGELAFDPMEFTRLTDAKRQKLLADLVGLDLDEYDRQYKELYAERTDHNKEKKRLEGRLAGMAPPEENESPEETSAQELINQITELKSDHAKIDAGTKRIKQIEEQVEKLEREAERIQEEIDPLFLKVDKAPKIDDLENQLVSIEAQNIRAREVQEYNKIKTSLQDTENAIGLLNDKMELIKIEKAEAVENSDLPLDSLELTPDGLRFKNVPFEQLSTAEQIKISLTIAIGS
jgi:DNA repair exonuclease SbcCD ATPase subunit